MIYPFTESATAEVAAAPGRLFEHLDDHARLAMHMEKRSMMMMGGRMTYAFDEGNGRAVGSVIRMGGSFLGISLGVEEAVIERDPPRRKVWETIGHPRLLVIGAYRMGFEIEPRDDRSELRVFIDYSHPASPMGRVLGRLSAGAYARWCVRRMADDAVEHFAS
jgi:hypothetical protein